ncbi:MAG: UDP-N-acetylmuramoyl-L-alanine--D-glutamate ligase [Desulfobacter sp.]|nr:UDP-N-acetylmuramoyl-L-alanine--D-glutamate ligase [Desulfobacter sp.]
MNHLTPAYDLVVGLGRSGLSMARFLKSVGRNVVATDIDPLKKKEAGLLESLGIQTMIGAHDQTVFDKASTIIPSPGIPLAIDPIKNAAAKGVSITGELDIFFQYNTTPVIAVTGTNGKTTTTSLVGEMIKASGFSCFVGGNIGTPLVDYLLLGSPRDFVVAEISSFQLDLAKTFTPHVGVLLNISSDHLDRYPDFRAYEDSKWSVFANQGPKDIAVINKEIQGISRKKAVIQSQVFEFSSRSQVSLGASIKEDTIQIRTPKEKVDICVKEIQGLAGIHNQENIAAAALAVLGAGGSLQGITHALANFTPLGHRMAFVKQLDGIRFFNDSKATNTDAVLRALESFDSPVILILGGREKRTDFTQLIPGITPHVKQIMAIGESKENIMAIFKDRLPVFQCTDMAHAVADAYLSAAPGDVVLLSPACASFDMYADYEERGRDFEAQVSHLGNGGLL